MRQAIAAAGVAESGRALGCLRPAPQGILPQPRQAQEGEDGGVSPTEASNPAGAVFLNYASQDAEAAQTICESLRASGAEVWFDPSVDE